MAISHPDDDPNPAHPNHNTDPHMAELPHTLSATQLQPFSLPQRLLAETNTAPPSRPYTANASARTSYTRVDAAGLEDALRVVEVDPEQSQGDDGQSKEGSVDEREEIPQTPQISLTFLLISGKRRTMGFEPETTVGRVKELIWNAWPAEWQSDRPPTPSHLRLLHLGKMLQDEDTLLKLGFPSHPSSPASHSHPNANDDPSSSSSQPTPISNTTLPNPTPNPPPAPPTTIVHLSIRPSVPPPDRDDALKKKKKRRTGRASVIPATTTTTTPVEGSGDVNEAGAPTNPAATSGDADEEGAGCCACVIC